MKTDKIVGNIVVFMLLIATVLPVAVTANNNWPKFQYNLENSGYTTAIAEDAYSVKWIYETIDAVSSSPAIVDGRVFIGSSEGKLYCLNASDGQYYWEFPSGPATGLIIHSSPAVYNGKVYFGSMDYKVYCVDAITGSEEWNYTTDYIIMSSPAVDNDKVFIGSMDGYLYCLNAITGSFLGRFPAGDAILSSPALANGKLYFGAFNGNVYCINIDPPQLEWAFSTSYMIQSSPAVVDGKVFIGSGNDGRLYCINADDGTELWNVIISPGAYRIDMSPAVGYGNVYAGTTSNSGNPCRFACLDINDGTEVWNYTNPYEGFASSPAIASDKVFVGSNDGMLYCFNAHDGTLIWTYDSEDQIQSSPAVIDNHLYVGSSSHKVIALEFRANQPPETPSTPDGPTYATIGEQVYFSTSAEDPEDGQVWYNFSWGDGQNSGWNGPYDSGETISLWHVWNDPGEYDVKVKAKDEFNAESSWSDIHSIQIGALVVDNITGGLGVTASITNIDNEDVNNVEWKIYFDGGLVLLPLGRSVKGTISTIPAGETVKVKGLALGVGSVTITVTADGAEASQDGFLLLFIVIIRD